MIGRRMRCSVLFFTLLAEALSLPGTPTRAPLCKVACLKDRRRPICGTNGVTYSSKCELQKALCSGEKIKVRYRGPCTQDNNRCFEERRLAMKTSNESGIPIFVPECQADGNYVEVQCHKGTGYCWCVTEEGKPVPGSSVRYSRPRCHPPPRSGTRHRRGKKRNKDGKKSGKGKKRSRACTQADRTAFSSNLVDMVSTEHRTMLGARGRKEDKIPQNKKEVVEWKFSQLDEDRDGVLKKKELKMFRAEVKKVVRPRRCGRSFFTFCDMDSNRRISRQEWSSCVGIEENSISFLLFQNLNSEEDKEKQRQERQRKQHGSYGGLSALEKATQDRHDRPRDQESSPSLFQRQFGALAVEEPQEDVVEVVDCMKERRAATQEARTDNSGAYIPECSPGGQYTPVQCHKSTGYCWCVEQESGRPIPGTSVKNARPDCNRPVNVIKHTPQRSWKKCDGSRRVKFLSGIMEHLTAGMVAPNNTVPYLFEKEPHLTLEQRVAKWKFIVLDKNNNGFLERKETQKWRREIKDIRKLRLCGKRIHQHCDLDHDNRISTNEWNICLSVQKEAKIVTHNTRPIGKRRGPNPLKTWLRSD